MGGGMPSPFASAHRDCGSSPLPFRPAAGGGVNGGVPYGATDEIGRKAALLRARVADARAFAADPALAWSAPPWRRGRGRRIAE
jgi:Protein of unknown function (DUF1501)